MAKMPDHLVLQVKGLKKYFPVEEGFLKKVKGCIRAVDDVSFAVKAGKTLGLVGESGCGKTTTARVILRALEPTAGEILFWSKGQAVVDLAKLSKRRLRDIRPDIQMIFQDPYSSLNPRMPVLDIVAEPLLAHGWKRRDCAEKVAEILKLVGLNPSYLSRYPHAFSGGQRQRIGIARALIMNPTLIVADEPVSALDVSVQAQILNLLDDLQEQMGLTFLFIAHDLSVIRYICDQVAVMYLGSLVELADTDHFYNQPQHPYTSALLSAVPDADPRSSWLDETISGEVGPPTKEMQGCLFAERCKYVQEICLKSTPVLREVAAASSIEHRVACHRAAELNLRGVK